MLWQSFCAFLDFMMTWTSYSKSRSKLKKNNNNLKCIFVHPPSSSQRQILFLLTIFKVTENWFIFKALFEEHFFLFKNQTQLKKIYVWYKIDLVCVIIFFFVHIWYVLYCLCGRFLSLFGSVFIKFFIHFMKILCYLLNLWA